MEGSGAAFAAKVGFRVQDSGLGVFVAAVLHGRAPCSHGLGFTCPLVDHSITPHLQTTVSFVRRISLSFAGRVNRALDLN